MLYWMINRLGYLKPILIKSSNNLKQGTFTVGERMPLLAVHLFRSSLQQYMRKSQRYAQDHQTRIEISLVRVAVDNLKLDECCGDGPL